MKRDAEATRKRILDAAVAEFAHYGIARARVERIDDTAATNLAMLYAYFTSKEGVFKAVFDTAVVRNMTDVLIDANNLPDYPFFDVQHFGEAKLANLYNTHR